MKGRRSCEYWDADSLKPLQMPNGFFGTPSQHNRPDTDSAALADASIAQSGVSNAASPLVSETAATRNPAQ